MKKGYRQGRLGEELRRLISDMLLRELKDPRLSDFVSVSKVEVTPDGSYGTVYLTALSIGKNDEEKAKEEEDILTAMRSAKGLIKREIGRQIKLRHVPDLIFKIDTSQEYGRHIDELIDKLEKDEEK